MNSRVRTVVAIAILLVACGQTVGAQSSSSLSLVDVPIPVYPPIAQSAMISGDVHVTVEVLPDGSVASASVARLEGFITVFDRKILEQPALDVARKARFRCEQCDDTPKSYSLVFAFRFADRIGRAVGDLHPEVVSISPSQSRILIVSGGPGPPNGPISERAPRPRAARCLWLWRCKKYTEPDIGEPEVIPRDVVLPAYPAAARANRAAGDIEVKVAVQRNGKVASAKVGATRNLVGSTQAIESAFQSAAVRAARHTTFYCSRCPQAALPYTLVYAFRFDGVLAPLDLGYGASGSEYSSSHARLTVAADVPILEAALGVRPDTLASTCRLAAAQPAVRDLPVSGNPWIGDDKDVISLIRARIAGHLGSDPPSRYELQLAEGVRETYVAQYVDAIATPLPCTACCSGTRMMRERSSSWRQQPTRRRLSCTGRSL